MYMSTEVGGHKVDVVSMPAEKNERRFSGFTFIVVRCCYRTPLAILVPNYSPLFTRRSSPIRHAATTLILMHYRREEMERDA
jgi:hypothetical protein